MSRYQRGKSWYYDFQYRGERYTGCIGPVSKTVAKEIIPTATLECIAKICPCKMAVLRGPVTRGMRV
jgi:hypothetical protein